MVFPAESFDPASTLRAIDIERSTHTQATPSILQALVEHPSLPAMDTRALENVSLSATSITPAHVAQCRAGPKATKIATRFGMSEGASTINMWNSNNTIRSEDDSLSVGYVVLDVRLRVCAPGSMVPLPRGKERELHVGGTQVIERYLGGDDQKGFYANDLGSWLVSDDRAVMGMDGQTRILGRYKDLIIRGGTNFSPAATEAVFDEIIGISVSHVTSLVASPLMAGSLKWLVGTIRLWAKSLLQSFGRQVIGGSRLQSLRPAFIDKLGL